MFKGKVTPSTSAVTLIRYGTQHTWSFRAPWGISNGDMKQIFLKTLATKSIFPPLFPLEGSSGSGCDMDVCSVIQLFAACSNNFYNLCCSFEVEALCHTVCNKPVLFLCLCFNLKEAALWFSSWQGSAVITYQIYPTTNAIWYYDNWNDVSTWRKRALWFNLLPGGTDSQIQLLQL